MLSDYKFFAEIGGTVMTREILDSDVQFAQRLLGDGRLDEEIVAALGYRGIESGNAKKLLADLRSGRKIRPQMILLSKWSAQRNEPD
jgi:hypothetical protein